MEDVYVRGLFKRLGFKTIADFGAMQWHYSDARVHQYVNAGGVFRNLVHNCGLLPMPANEGQIRPMVSLEPEDQVEVWSRVVTHTPVDEITAKIVKEYVLAFETKRAMRRPEETTEVTEAQNQDGHDGGRDQLQNEGSVVARPSDQPAQSPHAAAEADGRHDAAEANEGSGTERFIGFDALPLSVVGYLRQLYSGEPRPAPVRETIEQARASQVWINEIPLAEEQERRRRLVERQGSGFGASLGRDIIIHVFWAWVWDRNIQETSEGSGLYRMA